MYRNPTKMLHIFLSLKYYPMYGNLEHFRHLPDDLSWMIFKDPTNPLIVLRPDGESEFLQTEEQKMFLWVEWGVDREKDLILRVWQGKYKSDVFHIRQQDLPILFSTPIPWLDQPSQDL